MALPSSLSVLGPSAPVAPATLDALERALGYRLPRAYRDLLCHHGAGRLLGEFWLAAPEPAEFAHADLAERVAGWNPEARTASPIEDIPFEEWKRLIVFAARDRLELAFLKGDEDGPLWVVHEEFGRAVRFDSFEALVRDRARLDDAVPPAEGCRWDFPASYVTDNLDLDTQLDHALSDDSALSDDHDPVNAVLDTLLERASGYAVWSHAFESWVRAAGTHRDAPDFRAGGERIVRNYRERLPGLWERHHAAEGVALLRAGLTPATIATLVLHPDLAFLNARLTVGEQGDFTYASITTDTPIPETVAISAEDASGNQGPWRHKFEPSGEEPASMFVPFGPFIPRRVRIAPADA
ncbi:SMI1/KNR4 family protein [Chondromyces apiculatus]|uniref:Knr4/Smi1-like domain-containing protein n=1 Tax=Chondromyces apiculatus DSM 436 TaxID=1192034 RepID=A0A017T6P3_9BACT|nr:SMI1/KNR4 family protein [Chondromyces apiculatus]EYF04894.1 Hypothetical protein CAP_3705 [Chondromyces apiculatus DSM 436]